MITPDGDMIPAQDVIASAHLETYRKEHETIYRQLKTIKNNLFVFERIVNFPFDLFTDRFDRTFWGLASKAFFDSTVIALDTLLPEKGQRFALPEFRRQILEKYLRPDIDPGLKNQLQKQIDDVEFENRISPVREKIKQVRRRFIAHLDFDTQMGRDTTIKYVIALKELQKAVNIAHELFVVLSFDVYPGIDLSNYQPDAVEKFGTDIDDLLSFVASRSFLLTQFENEFEIERQRDEYNKLNNGQKDVVESWRDRVAKLPRRWG